MKKILFIITFFIFFISCKEVYNPPVTSPSTGYLVVDGFINSNGGISTITISRTSKLEDTVSVSYEHNAQVQIESENNEIFPLTEGTNGNYNSMPLTLNPSSKYRVRIHTTDGKEYLSDFSEYSYTPLIDSITWKQNDKGVDIYANAHDAASKTKYYRWSFDETWQIRSDYFTTLKFIYDSLSGVPYRIAWRDPVYHREDTTIWNCWQYYVARNIILGTTEKLNSDIIYLQMQHIETNSIKLGILYSIQLKQYAISKGAYDFYQQLRKNTEQLGSIFDAQPSELIGNIHCTTNPSDIVIGYIDITEEQSKRIFIANDQLNNWFYKQGCYAIIVDNQEDSIRKYGGGFLPTIPHKLGPLGSVVDFYVADPICVDCTLRGSNEKPSYWP